MSRPEEIIGRIKEALRFKASSPSHVKAAPPAGRNGPTPRAWLPLVPADHAGWVETFARNCAELRTQYYRLTSLSEIAGKLSELKIAEGWKLIASHRAPILDSTLPSLGLPLIFLEDRPAIDNVERADVGITLCDALIAQTGSGLLTSRSAGGRALSVLPPHHVVIALESQLLPDLPAAFERLKTTYADDYPSLITFITGPSRTGDIERVLVLGAHGPRVLTVLLVPDEVTVITDF
jgi:L-lactate dehydrogenase complex protein LldG